MENTSFEYTLTNDTLFKMLFGQHVDLLKRLVATLLDIPLESISRFEITNSEIQPETFDDKFCRLDINMIVNNDFVDLEIQVRDEHDYPERSLYYWAREFSSALNAGNNYTDLPRTVIISIVGFSMWSCPEFHSEFRPLEINRHEQLTDRMSLHYFELTKLPPELDANDKLKLWLALFNAKTAEDFAKIEALEVPEMTQTIEAIKRITATDRFKEIERVRFFARHNEATALQNARNEEREKWQVIVADKDAALVDQKAALADKDAEIARLLALINKNKE